jgi:hypothetical protein
MIDHSLADQGHPRHVPVARGCALGRAHRSAMGANALAPPVA